MSRRHTCCTRAEVYSCPLRQLLRTVESLDRRYHGKIFSLIIADVPMHGDGSSSVLGSWSTLVELPHFLSTDWDSSLPLKVLALPSQKLSKLEQRHLVLALRVHREKPVLSKQQQRSSHNWRIASVPN